MSNQRLIFTKNKIVIFFGLLVVAIGGDYLPLSDLSAHMQYDWNLFTTLSLVVGSSMITAFLIGITIWLGVFFQLFLPRNFRRASRNSQASLV